MNKSYTIISILLLVIISQPMDAQWELQGPSPSNTGQVEGITDRPISGAVNCVTPHPTDEDIIYIGSVNGGVWRSTDATSSPPSWTFISEDITSQSIGALEFDPRDDSNLTLVAVNGYYSSMQRRGSGKRGIFKTTTGIGPWTNIDTDNELPENNATGVAPRGDTIVLALGSSGIWRTTDNGENWSAISGSGTGLPIGTCYDLITDPADSSILYTVVRANGIYRSVDTGENWVDVGDAPINTMLATASNAELAMGNSNNVFAAIVSASNLDTLTGLFRTGNGIAPWTSLDLPTTVEDGITIGIHPGRQGSLHLSLAADPSNDEVVYIGGDRQSGPYPNSLDATTGSGRLFRVDASLAEDSQSTPITHNQTVSNSSPRADSRDMDFDVNGDLLQVDDGGVYKQTSPEDNTGDWFSLNGNLNVAESHSADWDVLSSIAMIGLQDNGVTQQVTSGDVEWNNISRGDGGDIAIADLDGVLSSRFYSLNSLSGFRIRTYDASNTNTAVSDPELINNSDGVTSILTSDDFGFVTPIKLNSQDGLRILIASDTALYESDDQASTVTAVMFQTVNGAASSSTSLSGRDVLVYGASDNVDVIYAGVDATVQVRTVAGGALTPALGYGGGTVNGITIDPANSQSLFVIDDNEVYQSPDGGASFSPITNNLSTLDPGDFLSIEYITKATGTLLALGTEKGVYLAAAPNFNFWFELSPDLPQARVEELVYDPGEEILAAALLGRGLWTYSFVERDPVDVALVLDFSGSMLNAACAGCDPKIDVLKEAVEIFLQIWKTLAVGDDSVTTVYFRTAVSMFDVAGDENLNVIDNTDAIIADVNAQTTVGNEFTALGAGIQTAIEELDPGSRPKHVVVFSDGMQNVDPGVSFPSLEILDGEFTRLSGVTESVPPTDLSDLDSIRVHTIGVGATPAFETQLSDIALGSDGLTKITTAPDDDLIQFYIEQLVEILRDYSPQLITYRKNTIKRKAIETVDINTSASQVLFKVSYPKGEKVNATIKYNGQNVTRLAEVTEGSFYKLYYFTSHKLAQFVKSGNTKWTASLNSKFKSVDYHFAVIADELILDYNFGFGKSKFRTGNKIKLFADLKIKKKAFKGDAKVTAKITYPTVSFGNVLSNYKLPSKSNFSFEKGISIGEKKAELLLKESGLQKIIQPKVAELELKKDKSGQYTTQFANTKVCGNYSIEYTISGKNEETGYFERTETRNFIIRFGKVNLEKSNVTYKKQKGNTYKLTLRPIDINNNLLGPDQLNRFELTPKGGKVTSQKDNGDGSYTFTIKYNNQLGNYRLKYNGDLWINSAKNKSDKLRK